MAKKTPIANLLIWVLAIVEAVVIFGLGGLFLAGGFLEVIVLKILPLIVHQIVGVIVMVTAVLKLLSPLVK